MLAEKRMIPAVKFYILGCGAEVNSRLGPGIDMCKHVSMFNSGFW